MNPPLRVSRATIELIKRFEGFRGESAQLADGRWVVGYGHTKTARQDVQISEQDAEALLLYDLAAVQAVVNAAVFTPLTQNQFDALTAFAFNIGVDNFHNTSALRRVNEGNLIQAACAIEMWRKADLDGERIVVDALVRRRAAEKTLFLTPDDGWTPAPSPIVRPRVDYDVAAALPKTSAEAAYAVTDGRLGAHRVDSAAAPHGANLAEADAGIDLVPPPPAAREDAPPSAAAPTSDPGQSSSPRPIAHREASKAGAPERSSDGRDRPSVTQWLIQAFIGLALFLGAVCWGLAAEGAGGLADPVLVAALLGLAGAALVANAVYFLLARLGGSDR